MGKKKITKKTEESEIKEEINVIEPINNDTINIGNEVIDENKETDNKKEASLDDNKKENANCKNNISDKFNRILGFIWNGQEFY